MPAFLVAASGDCCALAPVPGAHCYGRWGAVAGHREIAQDNGAVMEGFLEYRVTAVTVWSAGYQYSTTGLYRGHGDERARPAHQLDHYYNHCGMVSSFTFLWRSRLRTILNDGITWCGTRSPLAELRANNAGSFVGKRLC